MNGFFFDWLPWVWLALCVIFGVVEAMTFSLTTIWFAFSALVMVFLSFLRIPLPVQLLVFASVSAILMIFTRPLIQRKLMVKKTRTNIDALAGKKVLLSEKISGGCKGQAAINGVVWNVMSEDGGEIEAGTECEIVGVRGATLVVRKAG